MADAEFQLQASQACRGENGGYQGALYYMEREQTKRLPVYLGDLSGGLIEPEELVDRAMYDVEDRGGGRVEYDQLIALSALRVCIRQRHEDGKRTPAKDVRLERVAAIAITQGLDIESIREPSRTEKQISAHGFAHARRTIPGASLIDPLIHLPLTAAEKRAYPVRTAIQAAAQPKVMSRQPYIALHRIGDTFIEHIIPVQNLK
jgi:hypothetical protein